MAPWEQGLRNHKKKLRQSFPKLRHQGTRNCCCLAASWCYPNVLTFLNQRFPARLPSKEVRHEALAAHGGPLHLHSTWLTPPRLWGRCVSRLAYCRPHFTSGVRRLGSRSCTGWYQKSKSKPLIKSLRKRMREIVNTRIRSGSWRIYLLMRCENCKVNNEDLQAIQGWGPQFWNKTPPQSIGSMKSYGEDRTHITKLD